MLTCSIELLLFFCAPLALADVCETRWKGSARNEYSHSHLTWNFLCRYCVLEASFENAKERDFLGPKIPEMKYWQIDFRPAAAFAIEPVSLDGVTTKGLRITNADIFQLYTLALLAPHRDYILTAKVKSKISPDCRIQLRLDWLSQGGVKIESLRLIQFPNGLSKGYLQLEIPLIAPEQADKAKISLLVQRQGKGDFIEIKAFNFLTALKSVE